MPSGLELLRLEVVAGAGISQTSYAFKEGDRWDWSNRDEWQAGLSCLHACVTCMNVFISCIYACMHSLGRWVNGVGAIEMHWRPGLLA